MCLRIFVDYPFGNMSWLRKTFSLSRVSPYQLPSNSQVQICSWSLIQTSIFGLSQWFAVAFASWPTGSRAATWNICPPMTLIRKGFWHHILMPTISVSIIQGHHQPLWVSYKFAFSFTCSPTNLSFHSFCRWLCHVPILTLWQPAVLWWTWVGLPATGVSWECRKKSGAHEWCGLCLRSYITIPRG